VKLLLVKSLLIFKGKSFKATKRDVVKIKRDVEVMSSKVVTVRLGGQ
jgi:hypothetical protein